MAQVTPRFRPGDLVAVSDPWVFTVTTQYLEDACYYCLSIPTRKLPRCTGCNFARYCAQDCQKRDWKLRHKDECVFLKIYAKMCPKLRDVESGPTNYFLLLIKVITKLKNGREMDLITYQQYPGQSKAAMRDLQLVQKRCEDWTLAIRAIDPKSKYHSDIHAFGELYSKITINGTKIVGVRKDGCRVAEGLALYEPGVFGTVTACNRNVTWYSQDKQLFVKATKFINVGDPLIFSQLSPFASTKDRRFRYGEALVQCNCDVCNIPEKDAERNAFKCGRLGCSNAIPSDERAENPCVECGRLNNDRLERAAKCVRVMEEACDCALLMQRMGAPLGPPQSGDALISFIEDAEKILHPTNFTLGLYYKMALLMFKAAGMEDQAVKCVEKMLLPIDTHTDPYLDEPIWLIPKVILYYARKDEHQLAQQYLADFRKRLLTVCSGSVVEMQKLEFLEDEVRRLAEKMLFPVRM